MLVSALNCADTDCQKLKLAHAEQNLTVGIRKLINSIGVDIQESVIPGSLQTMVPLYSQFRHRSSRKSMSRAVESLVYGAQAIQSLLVCRLYSSPKDLSTFSDVRKHLHDIVATVGSEAHLKPFLHAGGKTPIAPPMFFS